MNKNFDKPDILKGEIVIYQPTGKEQIQLEVRIENESVWLNRHQIATLFDRDVKTIGKHISNALKEELKAIPVIAIFATTASDGKIYQVEHYNLDMIISIGYRVKSQRGVQFRIWANKILKDYLLKGYAVNQRITKIENDVHSLKTKVDAIDFRINTNLPPHEGIFYDGQIFDAWQFVSSLIKSAKKSIVLIDNYIDESVLLLLEKRQSNVKATIYTSKITQQLKVDIEKFNAQYDKIEIKRFDKSHDRFLIIDEQSVYHIGASLKDLGKKWFAFSKIGIDPEEIVNKLEKAK
ncbi:MAG: RhuM family protein [Candidatus Neomarinimicrobiota bacterium]